METAHKGEAWLPCQDKEVHQWWVSIPMSGEEDEVFLLECSEINWWLNKNSKPTCDDGLNPDISKLEPCPVTITLHGMLHDKEVVCCGDVVQRYQGLIMIYLSLSPSKTDNINTNYHIKTEILIIEELFGKY